MKTKLLLSILLLNCFTCIACLNGEKYLLKNQRYLYLDHETTLPFGHEFLTNYYDENVFQLDSLYKKTKDLDFLSDKGLILILQKKYDEALKIYQFIEKISPNRYSTASNIGTLYELIGENQKALYWINKAIEINPNSHNNSEWLHSKILEAKIKGETYFTGDFLLNISFGNAAKPQTQLTEMEIKTLEKTLFFQLNERISFIKPKDKIVGALLFELGNIKVLRNKFNDAKLIYLKAKEYGFNNDLINMRLDFVDNKLKPNFSKHDSTESIDIKKTLLLVIGIIILLILTYIIFNWTKRRK